MDRHYGGTAGDSSPRSREIEVAAAAPSASRVKLIVSYGGRIQPRHDQLSYIGGETKILALDGNIRFRAFLVRIRSLLPAGSPGDICLKYQLPGEDLDALISITNDEDIDHMMAEYDRLFRSAPKSAPRLRLFVLSPVRSPPPEQEQWFLDALNSVPNQPAAAAAPDYLFGFDNVSVPPPAKSDQGSREDRKVGGEAVVVVSSSEMQRQIHEQQQVVFQVGSMSRSSSNVSLSSPVPPGEHCIPRAEDKAAAAPYWPEQRGRFGSMDGGDQPIYLIPAGPGVYPRMHTQVCYAVPRMMPPPEAYREAAPVYVVPPSPQPGRAPSPYPEGVGAGRQQQEGAGYQVAYDSAGRAVYYASAGPTYHTVTTSSAGPTKPVSEGPKGVKQSQAS